MPSKKFCFMGKDKKTTKRLRVAIDGPAGAGKSTAARLVAGTLGYLYVDTGAMYRALAVTAADRGIPLTDYTALGNMSKSIRLTAREDKGVFRVWVDDVELTQRLRTPDTDRLVKVLSMARPVREVLVQLQRDFAREGGIVMEGRDITSVVLPDAEVKVFLTASQEERARRRHRELLKRGIVLTLEEVKIELAQRDAKDQERDWGKLVKVEDAVFIDSTDKTPEEVAAIIVSLSKEKERCYTQPAK